VGSPGLSEEFYRGTLSAEPALAGKTAHQWSLGCRREKFVEVCDWMTSPHAE